MHDPYFKYHPNPLETGSVIESDSVCECCEEKRGFIYTGPVYSIEELEDAICPWCIASGLAHEKFDAEFCDSSGIGGYGDWDSVPDEVIDEVAFRTPGFSGWQQEKWWTHCGTATQFLGVVGCDQAYQLGKEFTDAILKDANLLGHPDGKAYLDSLDANHGPSAYAFKCLECGALGGYSDSH